MTGLIVLILDSANQHMWVHHVGTENEILKNSWYLLIQCPPSAKYSSCTTSFNPHNYPGWRHYVWSTFFFRWGNLGSERLHLLPSLQSQSAIEAELESRAISVSCSSPLPYAEGLEQWVRNTASLKAGVLLPSEGYQPHPKDWSQEGSVQLRPQAISSLLEVIPSGCLNQPLFQGTRTSIWICVGHR